jgi:hypothetical protein
MISLIGLVFLIATGWCVLISVYPRLASATTNELYGIACMTTGWGACRVGLPQALIHRRKR